MSNTLGYLLYGGLVGAVIVMCNRLDKIIKLLEALQ